MQSTSSIVMIRPAVFRMNEETAVNNFYQKGSDGVHAEFLTSKAQAEFDGFVFLLKQNGIDVHVIQDTLLPETPDSLFPNNWISFHDNEYVLYPMFAENRRHERTEEIISQILSVHPKLMRFDFSPFEKEQMFLEGTGSLVLDRIHKCAYAALSPRTDVQVVKVWCEKFGYEAVTFQAFQTVLNKREKIYHTNVMMTIGTHFALICPETIDDLHEREEVLSHLQESGRTLIFIDETQVNEFAGNMLELKSKEETIVAMSSRAFHSLHREQMASLEKCARIIHTPLDCIEKHGGGSARCMIAEVF